MRPTARRLRLRTGIVEDCVLCNASKVCRIDVNAISDASETTVWRGIIPLVSLKYQNSSRLKYNVFCKIVLPQSYHLLDPFGKDVDL